MLKHITTAIAVIGFTFGSMALGFLTPGYTGIIPEKARDLGLPGTYFFREVPFKPDRLNQPCAGSDCVTAGNFVLNQEVTGL